MRIQYLQAYLSRLPSALLDACLTLFVKTKKAQFHEKPEGNHIEIVWIGHATCLVNMNGVHILTDPVFAQRVLLAKRRVKQSLKIKQLKVDIVVLSHSHFDHMDTHSIAELEHRFHPIFVVPKGYATYMKCKRVQELEHGQSIEHKGVTITAHKPVHWTSRLPWQDFRYLNAYVFEKGKRILFAGDTAYTQQIAQDWKGIADIAIMPIGCYSPDLLEKVHQTPEQALQLTEQIGATDMVPMHYETFRLSMEPLDEPRRRILAAAKKSKVRVHALEIGQKVKF